MQKPTKKGKRRQRPMDAEIARRMRALRQQSRATQEEVGEALGLTFQQVQKYEKGTNRMSGGTLFAVAEALGVSVADFFPSGGSRTLQDELFDLTDTKAAVRLLEAFRAIPDGNAKAALVRMVEAMAEGDRR